MNTTPSKVISDAQAYVARYVTFDNSDYTFAAAMWTLATFLWPHFDAFPYVTITSATKRSGKTRFAEILGFMCSNPMPIAGMTPATVFRVIRDQQPTMFMDEAEILSSESATMMRAVLNAGYRRGQTIPRMGENGVEQWPCYCPKVFVLIGDVFDTLRDRSIIFRMKRAEAKVRFVYDHASAEGQSLRERMASLVEDNRAAIVDRYTRHAGLTFLADRDEEIWLPLFAICEVLAPERVKELQRVAADMSTDKTAESARYVNLLGAEKAAEDEEYAIRLLRDLLTVINGAKSVFTADALKKLHELPTGPWRKFRGAGLSDRDMPALLSRFKLEPTLLRIGKKVARGYKKADVERALKTI
jgi:uncharacterized protein DUF3631